MYRRSQRWMLIINNRFLSVYDYNFLLFYEKIFSVKPAVDEKLKEKQMTKTLFYERNIKSTVGWRDASDSVKAPIIHCFLFCDFLLFMMDNSFQKKR